MERYKVILAYDGTAFSGMQRQASERTVQGEVENALAKLSWDGKSVLFAGRTDAGVHADGQVLSFEMQWAHSDQDLENALNATMPRDLAVRQGEKVDAKFHPRYDAKLRHYRYRIYFQAQRDPLRERYAWRQWPEPRIERLNAGAAHLIGEHDFASFGTPPKEGGPTVRKVVSAEWTKKDDEITFMISANAFLYHMVRRIVGQLVKVGIGKAEASSIEQLLSERKELIQELAPAQGLSLASVDYE